MATVELLGQSVQRGQPYLATRYYLMLLRCRHPVPEHLHERAEALVRRVPRAAQRRIDQQVSDWLSMVAPWRAGATGRACRAGGRRSAAPPA